MPSKQSRRRAANVTAPPTDFLLLRPDAEGIRLTRELYRDKLGRDLTDGEAAQALGMVMRHLYLVNFQAGQRRRGSEEDGVAE